MRYEGTNACWHRFSKQTDLLNITRKISGLFGDYTFHLGAMDEESMNEAQPDLLAFWREQFPFFLELETG